ncbi:MAG: hypothetical protein AAF518_26460 [Spirochaetota bacterium]
MYKIGQNIFISIFIFVSLLSSLSAEENTLNADDQIFIEFSQYSWKPSVVEYTINQKNSSLVSGSLWNSILIPSFEANPLLSIFVPTADTTLYLKSGDANVNDAQLSFGTYYHVSFDALKHRGKFAVNVRAPNLGTYNYLTNRAQTTYFIGTPIALQSNGLYMLDPLKVYRAEIISSHEFYFFSDHANKYLQGLGITFALNSYTDQIDKNSYLGILSNNSSVSTTDSTGATTSLALSGTDYEVGKLTQSIYVVHSYLGFIYRYAINAKQELDFSYNHIVGKGQASSKEKYTYFNSFLFQLLPLLGYSSTSRKTESDLDVNGSVFALGYTYKFQNDYSIRISYLSQTINLSATRSKTKSNNIPINEFGSLPTATDKTSQVGIEFQIKY